MLIFFFCFVTSWPDMTRFVNELTWDFSHQSFLFARHESVTQATNCHPYGKPPFNSCSKYTFPFNSCSRYTFSKHIYIEKKKSKDSYAFNFLKGNTDIHKFLIPIWHLPNTIWLDSGRSKQYFLMKEIIYDLHFLFTTEDIIWWNCYRLPIAPAINSLLMLNYDTNLIRIMIELTKNGW